MSDEIDRLLGEIPIFSELSQREISRLRHLMSGVQISEGSDLTVEGQRSLEAILILDGTADVIVGGEVLATVGPGEIVGELGVLGDLPRTATVRATSPVNAQVLTRNEFHSLLDARPEVARKLLTAVVQRLVELDEARC